MDSTISTKDLKSKLDKKQGITVVETLAPERNNSGAFVSISESYATASMYAPQSARLFGI